MHLHNFMKTRSIIQCSAVFDRTNKLNKIYLIVQPLPISQAFLTWYHPDRKVNGLLHHCQLRSSRATKWREKYGYYSTPTDDNCRLFVSWHAAYRWVGACKWYFIRANVLRFFSKQDVDSLIRRPLPFGFKQSALISVFLLTTLGEI